MFNESERHGFFLDSINVTFVRPLASSENISPEDKYPEMILALGSLPRNLNGLKSFMFLVDDLWLYVYDNRGYTGLMSVVFETAQKI